MSNILLILLTMGFTGAVSDTAWDSLPTPRCLDPDVRSLIIDSFWKAHKVSRSTTTIISLTVIIWLLVLILIGLEFGIHYAVVKIVEKKRIRKSA
nr:MAG: hypothetical protein [Jingmen bat rhabdovirus 3]WPV62820.1 MAG: hypothetical protein [Jingmen bat rhabdovirus 3]WPV62831.1 MAG: hypothetical protein [Jingmen bat rhabdovirus 3]